MSDYRVVGKEAPRRDARERVTGDLVYGMDFALPGMLNGSVLRRPLAHARIVGVDTTAARALPVVRAVFTGDEIGPKPLPFYVDDEPVLAHGKVRYAGEPVALVAATTAEIARDALCL